MLDNIPAYIVLKCGIHTTLPQGVYMLPRLAASAAVAAIIREDDDWHDFKVIRMETSTLMEKDWEFHEAVVFRVERKTGNDGKVLPIVTIDEVGFKESTDG